MTKIFTIPETAKTLRISLNQLHVLIREGKIESTKVGGRRLFSEAQLEKFVKSCAVKQ